MSIRIPRDIFTDSMKEEIKKNLMIRKKEGMNFGSFGNVNDTVVRCFDTTTDGYVLLPHSYAIEHFPNYAREDLCRASFSKNEDLHADGNLREEQKIIAKLSVNHLRRTGTTFLNCFPGLGKTRLFVVLSCFLKYKTVFLCTQEQLHKQCEATYREITNARCFMLSGLKNTMTNDIFENHDVFITTEKSAYKLKPFEDKIGTMIIDECHEFCSSTRISAVLQFRPKFIIACSASLQFRKDGLEECMYRVIGKDTTVIRRFERPFHVFRYLTYVIPDEKKNYKGQIDYIHMANSILHNDVRNESILEWIRLNMGHHKILVLTLYRDHAVHLHNSIRSKLYPQCSILMGNIRKYIDSKILVGTFQKIGTGFDAKSSAEEWDGVHFDMVLLTGSTKQMGWLEQLCGRVFRADIPIVVDFVDNHGLIFNQARIREKWYKMFENCSVKTTDIPIEVDKYINPVHNPVHE